MTAPTKIAMADGTEIDATAATCEGCGESLDTHSCGNGTAGPAPRWVVSRATMARKAPGTVPTCPHCTGRIHTNMSSAAVNAECITRQYALDQGIMTDPNGRLPVLTVEMMKSIVDWAATLSAPLTYGKMESAAGGAGTYAGLRPKTGRKKKAVAAAAGERIEDLAASVEVEAAPKGKAASSGKGRRGKKSSKASSTAASAVDTESSPSEAASAVAEAEEIVAQPKRRSKGKILADKPQAVFVETPPLAAVVEAEPAESDADKRRRDRAERRKQLLSKR